MDGAVRETLCSSCSHINVCAHKDDYLNMVKSLQETFYKLPENERDFMYLRDPDCKFCSKELSIPRFLTQNMNIPENADAKSCAKMIAEEARNLGRDMKQNLY